MPHDYRPWSRQEYDHLERRLAEGAHHAGIARELGRTLGSVQATAARLALTDQSTAWNRRKDWPAIDRLLLECIECRGMTVPQAGGYIAAMGHPVNVNMLYPRLKGLPKETQRQARENSRLRRAATAHRMRMRIKRTCRQQQEIVA